MLVDFYIPGEGDFDDFIKLSFIDILAEVWLSFRLLAAAR